MDPQPARAPATLALLESVDLMMPLAIPDPGYYTVGVDAVPLTVYVNDASTNNHTLPVVLWSNGDTLYVAVKSTHALQWMTLQGVLNTGMDEYDPWVPIYIDGDKYDPTGLSGNTGSSHWTVFSGPISSLDLSQPLTYSYFIKGIGGGHDVSGTFDVEPPVVSVGLSKVWAGGLMPEVAVNLMRKVGTGAGVLVSTHTLTSAEPAITISDLPYTDSAGRIYSYYVVEPTPPAGYAFSYTASFDAEAMAWTIVGTNTFTPPTGPITAGKVWDGGPTPRPTVTFQLYRDGVLLEGETKTITAPATTAIWEGMPLTDTNGVAYVYSVEEVTVPTNYAATKDGPLIVRNTYVPPLMDLTLEKAWEGGPTPPPVVFQLTRNGIDEVGATRTLASGETSVVWKDLPATTQAGVPILWSAREVNLPDEYGVDVYRVGNTIYYTNIYEPPMTDVRVLKVFEGGPMPYPDVELQLERRIDGATDWEVIASVVPTQTLDDNIYYYIFNTARTDGEGEPYIFRGNEASVPENYTMTRGANDPLIVINTYTSPDVQITGEKHWVDGPAVKPDVSLQLYRDGEPYLAPVTVSTAAGETSASYTWTVPKTDMSGVEYVYTIDEVTVPTDYTKSVSVDGLTVTNTYVPPLIDVEGTKIWDGGQGMGFPFDLQLTQSIDGGETYTMVGDPVTVGPRQTTYTWEDQPATTLDGTVILYRVTEPNPPANYDSEQVDDFTIRNVYTPPLRDFTGYKVWEGGSALIVDVELQLYVGATPVGDPVTLPVGDDSYTWTDIPATDHDGLPLSYWVDEVVVPAGFTKTVSLEGDTITNTYASDKIEVIGRKVWIGGPESKPDIQLQLFRDGVAFGDPVTVAGDSLGHTWVDLDRTDGEGVEYTYTIDEVDVPENYVKEIAPGGLTITNTYVSPKIDVTGTKVWVGGATPRPTIELQLYRDGIPLGDPVELADGTTTYTWVGVDENDATGHPYAYTVDEVSHPADYVKVLDGLTVTNTYVSPKIDVTGTKVWVGGATPRPTIELQLYRDGIPLGDPVELADGTTTYTWKDLDATDGDAKAYTYTVREVKVPEGYTSTADGLKVTNTAKPVTVTVPVKASPKTGDVATGAIAAVALGALGLLGITGANRLKKRRER